MEGMLWVSVKLSCGTEWVGFAVVFGEAVVCYAICDTRFVRYGASEG